MKFIIFTLLCLFLGKHAAFSQSINSKKLDEYFNILEGNNKFMGSVSIIKEGNVIYQKSIGNSNEELNKKNTDNTRYRIGSISKTFTATLILKAVEEGLLSVSDTIDIYFPTIKNANKITIANLLNHSSGIHNFTIEPNYVQYYMTKQSESKMIERFSNMESDFEPNTKAEYSNSNYVLLSYILEKVYKQSFAEILQQKIAKPLNLIDTYFGDAISLNNNENYSYRFLGNWKIQTETNSSIPMGAGAIVSTPKDLAIFISDLFQGKIISQQSLNTMTTINKGFGFGIIKIPFYNHISFGHNGMIDGFNSSFGYFPKEKVGFALASNGLNYEINDILITVLNSIFSKEFELPTFETIELSSIDLDKYLGTYSSEELPIKFSFTKSENNLIVQATGQSKLILAAFENHTFKFEQVGAFFQFYPETNQMDFKQNGAKYTLTKEK